MRLIDEQYTKTPFFGSRKMTAWFKMRGHSINRKRVTRLMNMMGISAIFPGPKTTNPVLEHFKYPYLLRNLEVEQPGKVWCADITYIRLRAGFAYMVAIMDWFSRHILSWRLSPTLETDFCLRALDEALTTGRPEIFNTDQGSQFTSLSFTHRLIGEGVNISMDGRGRAADNIFIERFWRTLKYEEVYLKDYTDLIDGRDQLGVYVSFYNTERPHQSLGYRTPAQVHFAATAKRRNCSGHKKATPGNPHSSKSIGKGLIQTKETLM
jgi:putative transposase